MEIAQSEGLRVEPNALSMIIEQTGNDVRQVLNMMQMWRQKSNHMSFEEVKRRNKEMNKDSVLRINAFDGCRFIFNEAHRAPLLLRSDAYFVDYDLMPMMIQQNYASAVNSGSRGMNPIAALERFRQPPMAYVKLTSLTSMFAASSVGICCRLRPC